MIGLAPAALPDPASSDAMEQQGPSTTPSSTPPAEQAADLAAVQAALQAHVQQLQQLVPAAVLIDSESKLELLEQLQESLSSAQALVDAVAEQQRLTGRDPLTPAAFAAALAHAPWAYEEDDEGLAPLSPASKGTAAGVNVAATSDDSGSESDDDQRGTAEAYGELSAAGRQQLLAVMGVADALDRSQLIGLAHIAKCSPHHVRSLFSELRTRLRNHAAAAARRASKAAAAEAAAEAAAAAAAAGEAGAQQQQQQQQQPWMSSHPGYYAPPLFLQQQQQEAAGSGSWQAGRSSSNPAAAAAAAAGPASPALGPASARLSASIASQRERLAKLLDAETGVIVSGGRFLGLLGSLTTWAARSSALAALAASYSNSNPSSRQGSSSSKPRGAGVGSCGASAAVRGQLASSRLLDVLEGWLGQARKEQQTSLLRQLLQVLPAISLSSALLQSSPLAAAVAQLHSHPNAAVAAAARAASLAWAATTGQAAPPGLAGKQHAGLAAAAAQYAAPGGLIQCGGGPAGRAVSGSAKRRVTLAVKRQLQEMELTGDLKPHTAAAAAAGNGAIAGGGTAGAPGGGQLGSAATGTAAAAAAAAASRPAVLSSSLKKPSKRAGAAPAAGTAAAAAAAAAGSQPVQGQTPASQASRRLAVLGGSKPAGGLQGQQRQQQPAAQAWAALPQQQRLHAMAQHGRAPASFLAAAGAVAGEVTQAVQAYDAAVQRWQLARCSAAAREQQAAEAAHAALAAQPQGPSDAWLWSGDSGTAAAAGGGLDVAVWRQPPPAVPDAALVGVAAGGASQLAPKDASGWRERCEAAAALHQQQGRDAAAAADPLEPDQAAAAAAAAATSSAAGGAAAVVPLVPVAEAEAARERISLWLAGIRLPCHISRPPTSAEISRERQRQQQAAMQAEHGQHQQQQQQAAMQAEYGQQQQEMLPADYGQQQQTPMAAPPQHPVQFQQHYQDAAPQVQQQLQPHHHPQYLQQQQQQHVVAVQQQQLPQVLQYQLPHHQQAAMQPLQQQPYLQVQQQYHPHYQQPVQQQQQQQHIQVFALDPATQQPQLTLLPAQQPVLPQHAPAQPQVLQQVPPGYAAAGYQQQVLQPVVQMHPQAAQQQVVYVVGPHGMPQQMVQLPPQQQQQHDPHQQGYFPQGY
uniref:TFIIS N-terminal domain-containing protein n=1 Tax=Tetradesmus obliquus TaxID=3088 RepID=A0A383V6H9_TETOB|eukprot:jgi/Sobl393_1/17060/SZX60530.1